MPSPESADPRWIFLREPLARTCTKVVFERPAHKYLFAQLEQDWRGWDDARSWRSLEGDLGIEARHEFRHVQLRVTLRAYGPGWGNDGWKASANLTIDPGEQLSQIAAG